MQVYVPFKIDKGMKKDLYLLRVSLYIVPVIVCNTLSRIDLSSAFREDDTNLDAICFLDNMKNTF